MNTPPQVDALLKRLSGPFTDPSELPGPSWRSNTSTASTIESTGARVPRPLHRRLSPSQRSALVAAYASGVKQKDLAAEYGISIRSVKRLLQNARTSGLSVRTRAARG
ncbi:sigma factor-like helix-turn-helix DNA-binding protein [Glycomyces sp. NPDC047369]